MVCTTHYYSAIGIVSSLISYGADVNRKDRNGKTPLFCACMSPAANTDVVQLLVDSGVAVNDLDCSGYSPLLCAVLTFKFDIVKILIRNGARIDVMTQDGNTAVHIVILSNNPMYERNLAGTKIFNLDWLFL